MTQRKITSSGITENIEFQGDSITIPAGTTAERPATASPGMLRFNTDFNKLEQSDGSAWITVDSPPVISTVSTTSFITDTDTITINGTNFSVNPSVVMVSADGVTYTPDVVVRNSSSSITITPGATLVAAGQLSGKDPFDIKVINNTGLFSVYAGQIQYDPNPTWVTAGGSYMCYDIMRSGYSLQLSVTSLDPDDVITYSILSGSLPSGMSLNTATGLISNDPTAVVSDTTYNFTVRASNGSKYADRAFSITVKAPVTLTYNYTGSDQSLTIPTGLTKLSATMWGAAGGYGNAEGYSDAGGAGGYTTGTILTSTLSALVIQVGQGGGSGQTSRAARSYPNGGLGALRSGYVSGNGGGRSAIFSSSVAFANSIMIAGGGGGAAGHGGGSGTAGSNLSGGCGGGESGSYGNGLSGLNGSGAPGTQSSGGASYSATRPLGRNGDQLQGADAGDGQLWSAGFNATGGGGDGYYGGGAKDDDHGGGGGGSGYLHPSLTTGGQTLTVASTSGKKSTNNPAGTGHPAYTSGIGVGYNNGTGGNGKVVITY